MYAVQAVVGSGEITKGDKRRKRMAEEDAAYCQACPEEDRTRLALDNKTGICQRCKRQGRKPLRDQETDGSGGGPAGLRGRRWPGPRHKLPHLKRIMREKGIGAVTLSRVSGRDERTIADYYNVRLTCPKPVAEAMARKLGVALEDLGWEEQRD